MKILPRFDQIVIRPVPLPEGMEKGGDIDSELKSVEGVVVAVGPGRLNLTRSDLDLHIEPGLKAGDRVLHGPYSGTAYTIEGEKYLIMCEDDILAILETDSEPEKLFKEAVKNLD